MALSLVYLLLLKLCCPVLWVLEPKMGLYIPYFLCKPTNKTRHNSFTSDKIPITEDGQIYLILVTALCFPLNLTDTKGGFVRAEHFTGNIPMLTPIQSFMTCICPLAFASTNILANVV